MAKRQTTAGALLALLALLPLGVACSGHSSGSAGTHVLAVKTTRALPACSGWFVMSGSTVIVHLSLTGDARTADVVANEIDWGDVDLGVRRVPPGTRNETLRYTNVTSGVLSMKVHTATGSCGIISPH